MFGRRVCPHAAALPAAARNCRREIPISITYTTGMRAIALLAIVTMTLSAQPPPVKDDWDCVIRRGNPAVQMWRAIREELLGKSGDAYMAQLKTATFPTFPATILAVFRGQQNPTFLVSVDDGGSPDAIVRLTGPWTGPPLQPGMELDFDGAAVALTRNPFRLLIDVAPAKVQLRERSNRNNGSICECYPANENHVTSPPPAHSALAPPSAPGSRSPRSDSAAHRPPVNTNAATPSSAPPRTTSAAR